MIALLRDARGAMGRNAGTRPVAGVHHVLAVQAGVCQWRALGARVHTLRGRSVIQCHSVLIGQALGIYLDLLLRILALLREFPKLVAGHGGTVHSACARAWSEAIQPLRRGGI